VRDGEMAATIGYTSTLRWDARAHVLGGGVLVVAAGAAASVPDVSDPVHIARVFLVCAAALVVGVVSTTPRRAELACTSKVAGGGFVIVVTLGIQFAVMQFGARNTTVLLPSAALMVWGLFITGFWKRWRIWKAPEPDNTTALLVTTAAALLVSIQAAALVTANIRAIASVGHPLWRLEAYYGWHFLDNIPILKVPETLHLAPPITTTSFWCGLVLLAYEVLVVLPVFAAATHVLRKTRARRDA
jgi:hypothetical protein